MNRRSLLKNIIGVGAIGLVNPKKIFSFYQKEELTEVAKKWEYTGLLEKTKNIRDKNSLAACLDSQLFYEESLRTRINDPYKPSCRISMPLITRLYLHGVITDVGKCDVFCQKFDKNILYKNTDWSFWNFKKELDDIVYIDSVLSEKIKNSVGKTKFKFMHITRRDYLTISINSK